MCIRDRFSADAATERYDGNTGTDATSDLGYAGGTLVAATAGTYDFGWTAAASDGGVSAAISIREASTANTGVAAVTAAADTVSAASTLVTHGAATPLSLIHI